MLISKGIDTNKRILKLIKRILQYIRKNICDVLIKGEELWNVIVLFKPVLLTVNPFVP